jgi:hypothetical protein
MKTLVDFSDRGGFWNLAGLTGLAAGGAQWAGWTAAAVIGYGVTAAIVALDLALSFVTREEWS